MMFAARGMHSDQVPAPPLVVDLDGTLTTCDTLVEGLALLVKQRPVSLLQLPFWLLRGRAAFKREVSNRVAIDPARLPYDARLLERLQLERARQRSLILCTAADDRIAQSVAAHLGLFDAVMATGSNANLSGRTKGAALVDRFGAQGFDYAANDLVDMEVFIHARESWLVNPTPALQQRSAALHNVSLTLPGPAFSLRETMRALRPHQWIKNLLIFVPLLVSMEVSHLGAFVNATLAFVAFCLIASCVYVVNDLLDIQDDRAHPRKRQRPLASGLVPVSHGMLLAAAIFAFGFAVAAAVSPLFVAALATYLASATAYSLFLKRVPLLDTLVLAGLYTLRILAGAAAVAVVPSVWLLAFSMFFFLSLALAKRHSELVELDGIAPSGAIPGREYRREDLQVLIAQGSASGYSAVLVLALYINSDAVRRQYNNPEIIWLICPLLLYWINKLWLNSQRREINDDPVIWAVTNRVSRAVAVLSVLLLAMARWLPAFAWPR